MDGLKQQSAQQLALLQLHAANTCGTTITTATSSSSGRGGGSSSSSSSSSGSGGTATHSVVKVQLVNADTGKRSRRVYTLNTAVLSRLHREEARQDSNVLLNLIASATVDDTKTAAAVASADIKLLPYSGTDFTELGFDCTIESLYAAGVKGVTYGVLDSDRARATLQAAQHFGLDELRCSVKMWAEQCGIDITTATTTTTAAAATSSTDSSGRKLQEQTVFSGPAGVAEQEGYTQFKPLEAEAFEKYNAAGLGDTEGGEPL
eukprot:11285-Heterococcus_DN1.PRE.1